MAEKSVELNNDQTVDLIKQNVTTDVGVKEPDTFYEEVSKHVDSDFLKLKEMEEGSLKIRKEIASVQLELASAINPQFKKAESEFQANVLKATATVQEIERFMSQELEDISKILVESNCTFD